MVHVCDSFLGILSGGHIFCDKHKHVSDADQHVSDADLCGWSIVEKKIRKLQDHSAREVQGGRKEDDEDGVVPHLVHGLDSGMYSSFILQRPRRKSLHHTRLI